MIIKTSPLCTHLHWLLLLWPHSSSQIGEGRRFHRTLVDSVVCILVASFLFAVFGLVGILDHMALGEVGFCGVVVWLGECILGRSGENVVVEAEVANRIARVGNLDQLGWQLGTRPFA